VPVGVPGEAAPGGVAAPGEGLDGAGVEVAGDEEPFVRFVGVLVVVVASRVPDDLEPFECPFARPLPLPRVEVVVVVVVVVLVSGDATCVVVDVEPPEFPLPLPCPFPGLPAFPCLIWPGGASGLLPLATVAGSTSDAEAMRAVAPRTDDLRRALGGVRPM
jgi:hypothetical protein